MNFVIYTASCTGNAANCDYSYKVEVDNPRVLKEAVKKDHVCASYSRLEWQMDMLDVTDPYYDRKILDLQRRDDEQYGRNRENQDSD